MWTAEGRFNGSSAGAKIAAPGAPVDVTLRRNAGCVPIWDVEDRGHDGTFRFEVAGRLISIIGDVDTLSTPTFVAAVIERADANDQRVDVDLAGVSFIDSNGLHALVRLRTAVPGMRVLNPSARVIRLLEITGIASFVLADSEDPQQDGLMNFSHVVDVN